MSLRIAISAAVLAGLAACGRGGTSTDANLRRDLELARGQGLELAPQGHGQTVVSAAELVPNGQRAKTAAAKAPETQPRVHEPSEPASATVAQVKPQVSPDSSIVAPPAASRPMATRPAVNPPPAGGYKTMGEIIRKAPFPINP